MSRQAGRAASALKSGVVYSGSAIVNGVNAITPHLAGAVDIMVVKQPDGSFKSSPFYVRFGKYTSLRSRDRTVFILVNGEMTGLHMHLGSYGQAYFVAEYADVSGSDEEAAYSGMMSPPSGYSSGEMDAPFANSALLASVRSEIDTLKEDDDEGLITSGANSERPLEKNLSGHENDSPVDVISEAREEESYTGDQEGCHEAANEQHVDNTLASQSSCPTTAPSPPQEVLSSDQEQHCVGSTGTMEVPSDVKSGDQYTLMQKSIREVSVSDLVEIHGAKSEESIGVENHVLSMDGTIGSAFASLTSHASIEFPSLEASNLEANTLHSSESFPFPTEETREEVQSVGREALDADSLEHQTTSALKKSALKITRSVSCRENPTRVGQVFRTGSAPLDSPSAAEPLKGEDSVFQERKLEIRLGLDFDTSPAEGYLGDSDQPAPGFLSPTSHPEPRIGGTEGLKEFQLSLCGHLLQSDMTPMEAQDVFEKNLISKDQFATCGLTVCKSPNLVCRISGTLYPWSAAAPMVLGMLAFGGTWDNLIQTSSGDWSEGGFGSKGRSAQRKVSPSWRLWPFGSWRGHSTSKSGDLSPIDTESPPSPTCDDTGEGIMEDSGAADSFSTHSQSKPKHKKGHRKGHRVVTRKTLNPTPEQLASLNLHDGQNIIEFQFGTNTIVKAYIYVIGWRSQMIISDIDGTVTRSDLLGHLLPPIGVDWTHSGVAHLFSNITDNGYEIMFLSSRAIAQANVTRDFLHSLEQGEHKMPVGPVIISPHGLLPSLYREMILRRPHDFKIGCLQDIRMLFPDDWNPFYAGFGNRGTDVLSYERAGVPRNRIFTINSKGQIIRGPLSSIQTSTWSTLQNINALVDEVFPPLDSDRQVREEFSDFNHWHLSMSVLNLGYDDPQLGELH